MHSRNAGLQRLRSLTKRVGVAAAVLTGIFAGLAAAGNPGKKHHRSAARPAPVTPAAPARPTRAPAPPSLPPVGDEEGSSPQPAPAPTPAPSPQQQAPVPTQAPPVAVTGGS